MVLKWLESFDADLKWLYEGEQSGTGRPKIYDGKVKFNETNRFNFHGKIEDDVELYNAIVYCPNMKKTVNVIMLLKTTQNFENEH